MKIVQHNFTRPSKTRDQSVRVGDSLNVVETFDCVGGSLDERPTLMYRCFSTQIHLQKLPSIDITNDYVINALDGSSHFLNQRFWKWYIQNLWGTTLTRMFCTGNERIRNASGDARRLINKILFYSV